MAKNNDFNTKDQNDLIDNLTDRSAKLTSMLNVIHGSGFDSFKLYNDTTKQNYLWACSDLATEINEIAMELAGA